MSDLSKKDLEHLSSLARIRLEDKEEEKLLSNMKNILDYVGTLKEADTKDIEPMNGGTLQKNVLREDNERQETLARQGKEGFPTKHGDFLEVPKVLNN
jgi:aspartyl-tRNA(Asn)/glutamyl-tRNA(Gln) amidotransferase subunit C